MEALTRTTAAVGDGADPELDVRVESRIPAALPPGCRSTIFVYGTCFHRRVPVRHLEVVAAASAAPAAAQRMPRLDFWRALHPAHEPMEVSADDPNGLCYRSGFWAYVNLTMPPEGALQLAVRAHLADGAAASAPFGSIDAAEDQPPGPSVAPDARVAIAMATFEPDPEHFAAQVESIRSQTLAEWVCVISDDRSHPRTVDRMRSQIGDDPRFVLSVGERRLGFYRNFERALRLVPRSIPYVALADQDDRWHPQKLAILLDSLGDAELVYSDMRVVDAGGKVIAEARSGGGEFGHESIASLLAANVVTGAASLFRQRVAELALPFPGAPGPQYHDHWLALVALATGRIARVERPLHDYVQHGRAAIGHSAATAPFSAAGLTRALAQLRRGQWRRLAFGGRSAYFHEYCRLRLLAETLRWRGGESLRPRARRTLRRFARAERSPLGPAWLVARDAKDRLRRRASAGAEITLARGIAWRLAIKLLAGRGERPRAGAVDDASVPTLPSDPKLRLLEEPTARAIAEKVSPLDVSVSAAAPERINVLVPTIDLDHFFGGYIAMFNLARRLAERGHRTRVLAVDPVSPLPRGWRRRIESYAGLGGFFDAVELEFARGADPPVELADGDAVIATTWWTAHVAAAMLDRLERSRFLYLIQEYEPYTVPNASWAALASASYELPHAAMFSTEILRDFFAHRGYGVFAAGDAENRSMTFRNAITPLRPPRAEALAARRTRRLLFYARPEQHGSRNMFELGLLALAEAASRGAFAGEWEFTGVGATSHRERIRFAPRGHLDLRPRLDQAGYAALLERHDVGLSLMFAPHPSLVPIEMASAGMLTVTNTFETKNAAALERISSNLIATPPTVDAIATGLVAAAGGVDDYERRARGAAVQWNRDWDQALGDEAIDRALALLDGR